MPRASASERSARRVRAAAVALSIAGGLGLFCGAATGAEAVTGTDTGSGGGGAGAAADSGSDVGGDGSLQLLPEVIANDGISAAASAEFPVTMRLFLPAAEGRAQQAKQSAAAVTRAAEKLSFERARSTSAAEAFTDARGRLFQDYSHQVISSAGRDSAPRGTDVWFIVLVAAGVPLTGLAAFLGLKTASRKASRHA